MIYDFHLYSSDEWKAWSYNSAKLTYFDNWFKFLEKLKFQIFTADPACRQSDSRWRGGKMFVNWFVLFLFTFISCIMKSS